MDDLRQLSAHLADFLDSPADFVGKLVHAHHTSETADCISFTIFSMS